MRCAEFRVALSARLDGEPAGLPERRLDSHLARCGGCRQWRADAERLRALGGPDGSGAAGGTGGADGPSAQWSARLLTGLRREGVAGHEGS
ncbi:zf-HC2 domain-containing protein [Kitasatospora sp. NPDC004240]